MVLTHYSLRQQYIHKLSRDAHHIICSSRPHGDLIYESHALDYISFFLLMMGTAIKPPSIGPPAPLSLVWMKSTRCQTTVSTHLHSSEDTFVIQPSVGIGVHSPPLPLTMHPYDAEIGTQIDITIEDTTITAAECFPLGRHSRYTAVTSVQGAWERLTFSKLDQPDAKRSK
jgi:hypothetical protein